MAAPTCIITLVKTMTYRGNPLEEFSNRYMFDGSTPSGPTVWHDLFLELAAVERACYGPGISIVRAYGHISTDPHATSVWGETLGTPLPGTLSSPTGVPTPGDDAVFVSFGTGRRNSKGKEVYCRKYFHGALRSNVSNDAIDASQKTALDSFGNVMLAGLTTSSRKLVDPTGAATTTRKTGAFVTTRTLKRRGRRP